MELPLPSLSPEIHGNGGRIKLTPGNIEADTPSWAKTSV